MVEPSVKDVVLTRTGSDPLVERTAQVAWSPDPVPESLSLGIRRDGARRNHRRTSLRLKADVDRQIDGSRTGGSESRASRSTPLRECVAAREPSEEHLILRLDADAVLQELELYLPGRRARLGRGRHEACDLRW